MCDLCSVVLGHIDSSLNYIYYVCSLDLYLKSVILNLIPRFSRELVNQTGLFIESFSPG